MQLELKKDLQISADTEWPERCQYWDEKYTASRLPRKRREKESVPLIMNRAGNPGGCLVGVMQR